MSELDYSYYELNLASFLAESHPDKLSLPFIKLRSRQAADVYTASFEEGLFIPQCLELANDTLYAGLHFSPFDTVRELLITHCLPPQRESQARTIALRLLPLLNDLFEKYHPDDQFKGSPQYETLCSEIVDRIVELGTSEAHGNVQ